MDRAARIALTETGKFLEQNPAFEKVVLVSFGQAALATYTRLLNELFP
jgi:O-acetyl-ADP-ribose deacetylase (regulator of RNase III)